MSLIEVNKLVKQYNKAKTPAVDGVSFVVWNINEIGGLVNNPPLPEPYKRLSPHTALHIPNELSSF